MDVLLIACMFFAQWELGHSGNCKVFMFQKDSVKRNDTSLYKTLSSPSLTQCAKGCAGESVCRSVSFNDSTELCYMMSDTIGPEVVTESVDDDGMQSYTMTLRCPTDYIYIDGTCLKLSKETSNYTQASDACLSDGAVLAQMTPVTVFDETVRRMFNNGTSPEGFFWVGSTDIEEEGTWRWNDGTPITPWLGGEPNNLGGNEDCLSLLVRATSAASFVDFVCGTDERYLCQTQPRGPDSC